MVQNSRLLSLLPELRDEILTYLPVRDIAQCRKTCHHLNDVIDGNEAVYARPKIAKELRRLQDDVDEFESLRPVEDASTLMDALDMWTSRRGFFDESESSYSSLAKLMVFLHQKSRQEGDEPTDASWQALLRNLVELGSLVVELNLKFRYEEDVWREPIQNRSLRGWFLREAALRSGPLGHDLPLLRGLYDWIKYPLRSEPFREIHGPMWPLKKSELSTVPGHGAQGFRLTDIRIDPYSREKTSPPDLRKEQLSVELGLPNHPFDNPFFYYYVKDHWLASHLCGMMVTKKKPLRPLHKAKILEHVLLF